MVKRPNFSCLYHLFCTSHIIILSGQIGEPNFDSALRLCLLRTQIKNNIQEREVN